VIVATNERNQGSGALKRRLDDEGIQNLFFSIIDLDRIGFFCNFKSFWRAIIKIIRGRKSGDIERNYLLILYTFWRRDYKFIFRSLFPKRTRKSDSLKPKLLPSLARWASPD
jgi:hypothetical protein